MKTAYLVLELGWEYDDSFYSTNNNGETFEAPEVIYMFQETAEKVCLQKNIEAFRTHELMSYFGEDGLEDSLEDGRTLEEVTNYMRKEFGFEGEDEDYWDINIPDSATDEQILGFMDLITLRFFQTKEIEIK